MPKVNVYLPDDLADAVREAGVPLSAVCQAALDHSVRRLAALRAWARADIDLDAAAAGPVAVTGRAQQAVRLAVEAATGRGAAHVTTGDLLGGILSEGGNLALLVLAALEIEPRRLAEALATAPSETAGGTGAAAGDAGEPGRRFGEPAVEAFAQAAIEALTLGHNYLGCEHLLLGLVAEPDGAAGHVLRDAGADQRSTRRAVAAALNGYAHLRAQSGGAAGTTAGGAGATAGDPAGVLVAVRQLVEPLVTRLDTLERRLDAVAGPAT